MKRFLSVVLAALLIISSLSMAALAANQNDITGNWAEKYITFLFEKGIMKPSTSGNVDSFKPNAQVSRAEFMRYINRTFQYSEKADVSGYTDLNSAAWYYDDVAIAVKQGYINGTGTNTMNPNGTITRQEVVTILGRIHKIAPEGSGSVTFKDKASIGAWAVGYVNDAVEMGYVVGYPDNTFRPTNVITRSEMSKILYYFMGNRVDAAGEFGSDAIVTDAKNLSVTTGASICDLNVSGNLYITEAALEQAVHLENVHVSGKLIVSGGKVTMSNVTAGELVVGNKTGRELSITASGNTSIGTATVKSSVQFTEGTLSESAGGFSDVIVQGDGVLKLTLDGSIWSLTVNSPAGIVISDDTYINSAVFGDTTTVTGQGVLENASIQANGVVLETAPVNYTLKDGVTAKIAGKTVSSSTTVTVTPAAVKFDKNKSSLTGEYADAVLTLSTGADVAYVANGTKKLEEKYYSVSGKTLTIKTSYLSTLDVGTSILEIAFVDASSAYVTVSVSDTSRNTLDAEEATFDVYESAQNHRDVQVELIPGVGNTFDFVSLNGSKLSKGTDYTYSNKTLTLKTSYLKNRSEGTYNFTISFSSGNDCKFKLTVTDSSPKNALGFAETEFDINKNSALYRDIVIPFTKVDGATLKDVKCGVLGTLLTPTADYYELEEDGTVVLRKAAVAELTNSLGKVEVTFDMSKGTDPVFTIYFVNTYNVTVTVTDQRSMPVKGATVKIGDVTLTTNTAGVAETALKSGKYTAQISYPNAETVTREFSVGSSPASVSASIETRNVVNIYVTGANGANISGATVTLGGKSVVTGENGLASFTVDVGSYTFTVGKSGYATVTDDLTVSGSVTTIRVKLL